MRVFRAEMFNFKAAVILLAVLAGYISAEEECRVSNINLNDGYYTNYDDIKDTHSGTVITFNTTNVIGASLGISKYLSLEFKDNVITLSTKDFEKYEKEETSRYLTDVLNIKCKEKTYKINYKQYIKFTNNHLPVFSKKEYKFVLYGQLKKGFDLTKIMKIQSTDYDMDAGLSSYKIFGESSDFLKISVDSYNPKDKTSTASLTAKKLIFPPFEKEFTITVFDDYYEPKNTANATLKIILKKPEQNLVIEESKYVGKIDEKTKKITTEKPIKVKEGIDSNLIINLQSEYADYFQTYLDYVRSEIKLKLVRDLPTTRALKQIDINLDLFNNGVKSNTNVLINLSNDVKEKCKLGDVDLTGLYSYINPEDVHDDHIGTVQIINDILNVKKVTCTGTEYLKCDLKNNVLTISTTEEFRKYEENERDTSFEMKMIVECPDETTEINYIQNIQFTNNHAPEFDKKEYRYVFYNYLTKNLKLYQTSSIKASDIDLGWTSLSFTIDENEFFKMSSRYVNETVSEGQLTVTQDIYAPRTIKLNLHVTDNDSPPLNNTAVLYVEIKPDFNTNLKFTQEKYLASYNSTRFSLPNPIQLENGFDEHTVFELKNSTYSKYFNVKPNLARNCVEILLKEQIEEIDEDYIVLSVVARWRGFWNSTDVQIQFNQVIPQVQIQTNLNGFSNWLLASFISQFVIALLAFIGIAGMILFYQFCYSKK